MTQPFALAVDGAGNILVGGDDRRISVFSPAGAYLGQAVQGSLGSGARGLLFDSGREELFVAYGQQISKYDSSTGALIGWAGGVAATPSGGDPGCTEAVAGTFTPGWCIGGVPANGSANGMFRAYGVSADAGYVYVADPTFHRVTRFDREQY